MLDGRTGHLTFRHIPETGSRAASALAFAVSEDIGCGGRGHDVFQAVCIKLVTNLVFVTIRVRQPYTHSTVGKCLPCSEERMR